MCVTYMRLYELSENRLIYVAGMFSLCQGEGGEAWKWIQMLFAWEEEILGECCALFHDVLLQVDVSDRQQWHLDTVKGYIVCGAYQLLIIANLHVQSLIFYVIWLKKAPLKVQLFIWRLLRNRIFTKANLFQRGIIHQDAQLYVSCYRVDEMA